MYLEFKEIKTLQDLVMIMTEVQTELREIKVILSGQVDRYYLTVSDIAKEMGYSDFTIKGWINKGRKHPFTGEVIKLKAFLTEGKHYRVMRSDLEDFKKVFMSNNQVS